MSLSDDDIDLLNSFLNGDITRDEAVDRVSNPGLRRRISNGVKAVSCRITDSVVREKAAASLADDFKTAVETFIETGDAKHLALNRIAYRTYGLPQPQAERAKAFDNIADRLTGIEMKGRGRPSEPSPVPNQKTRKHGPTKKYANSWLLARDHELTSTFPKSRERRKELAELYRKEFGESLTDQQFKDRLKRPRTGFEIAAAYHLVRNRNRKMIHEDAVRLLAERPDVAKLAQKSGKDSAAVVKSIIHAYPKDDPYVQVLLADLRDA